MTPNELDHFLRSSTEHEILYRQGWVNPDIEKKMETVLWRGQELRVIQLTPRKKTLFGGRHSRFSKYPVHIHPWVELNYMYSGQCTQRVNGQSVTLRQGQMLLLDQNTVHDIPVLGENDILLNIFLCREYLNSGFFNRISQNNLVSQFLLDSITTGLDHNNYLFFASENRRRLPLFIQEFFCEEYDPSECADEIMNSLFTLILTELVEVCRTEATAQKVDYNQTMVLQILKYIEHHARTVTLAETAKQFGMNPDYLSRLLKRKTGRSFQALVTHQRMLTARQLLTSSSMSVSEIANRVGYDNMTFFYKKFGAEFGCTPASIRHGNDF